MSELGNEVVEMLRDNIKNVPTKHGKPINTTGKTADSIDYEDTTNRFVLFSNRTGAPIATLQTGREGGAVPKGFNGIIKQWILDKGISVKQIPYKREVSDNWQPKYTVEERSLNMAAGAMAHTIAKKGTERYREPRADIYTPVTDFAIKEFKKRHTDLLIKELLK